MLFIYIVYALKLVNEIQLVGFTCCFWSAPLSVLMCWHKIPVLGYSALKRGRH